MLIHAYRRTEATPVELFGLTVHFKPNHLAHCVAEVLHEAAAERLLSITEAYRVYAPEDAPAAPAPAPSTVIKTDLPPQPTLVGSGVLPAEIPVGENFVELATVVQSAFDASGLTLEQWNAQPDSDREAALEQEVTRLRAAVQVTDEHDEQLDAQEQAAAAKELADAEAAAAKEKAEREAAGIPDPLVLVNEKGETLDLNGWPEKQVREFAEANGVKLPGGKSTRVADLRLLLAKGLKGE